MGLSTTIIYYLVRVGRQLRYVYTDHLLQTERVNCEDAFEAMVPEEYRVHHQNCQGQVHYLRRVLLFQRQLKTNLLRLRNLLLNQFLSLQLEAL